MTLLITGATGTVGTTLTAELAGRPGVRALVRTQAAAQRVAAAGLEPALGAFEDAGALDRALDGVETLFLLSPAGDRDMADAQVRVVDAAAAAGVRRIVKLSSIGADEDGEARIIRAHRDVERHIEASGVAWTHLRPHWFMQNELGAAPAVADGQFAAPDVGRISAVDARDVAAAAARVLTSPGHDGRAYVLTGPEAVSYADAARAYARALGRPVRWEPVTLEEARSAMVAGGLPEAFATGFAEILARYREGGVTATVSPDLERLLGRPGRSFAAFVADHAAAYTAVAAAA